MSGHLSPGFYSIVIILLKVCNLFLIGMDKPMIKKDDNSRIGCSLIVYPMKSNWWWFHSILCHLYRVHYIHGFRRNQSLETIGHCLDFPCRNNAFFCSFLHVVILPAAVCSEIQLMLSLFDPFFLLLLLSSSSVPTFTYGFVGSKTNDIYSRFPIVVINRSGKARRYLPHAASLK